jgi:F0F1-type ATP synthase membrane subunit b/b'
MFILNLILYNPLVTLINQRNEYILDNLSKASEMLSTANELTNEYETELKATKKLAQQEIIKSQKNSKTKFRNRTKVVSKIYRHFTRKNIKQLYEDKRNNFRKT